MSSFLIIFVLFCIYFIEKYIFLLFVFTSRHWLLSIPLLLSTCGKKEAASGFSVRNRERQNKYRNVPQRCVRTGIGSIVVQAKLDIWRKRWSQGLFVSPRSLFFLLCLGKHLLHVLKCISWLCAAHDREGKIVWGSLWLSFTQSFFSPAQALFIKPLYLSLI